MISLPMTAQVALLTIKRRVAQRLLNTKIVQKSIDANVRYRIKVNVRWVGSHSVIGNLKYYGQSRLIKNNTVLKLN